MDRKTWKRVEVVLDSLLELDQNHWKGYLKKEVCDDEIRREVELLIEAENKTPDFLEFGINGLILPELAISEIANDVRLGIVNPDRYEIMEEIGRGGMSVVYKARRTDDEFDQEVAIKIIQPFGLNREEQISRLRIERQILANLQHNNIARVFDGGVTPEGWPYMVMELVEGVSLHSFCRQNRLTLHERLKLFQQICSAVIYAHRNLVVHRDLKPSNILITGDGIVKLLDFGISKLLRDDHESVAVTQTEKRLLTPEYAAPEQFSLGAITTSADIYSLGVILYELLTDQRPFDLSGKSLAEAERMIQEADPPKPSARQHNLPFSAEKLRGDLETICLKALRKEPEKRYGTVQEFNDDIDRYFSGLPVIARPATRIYRIQKFVSRHKTGVAITAAVLIIITGLFLALLHQQAIALQERDRAVTEANKAEQVTDFLIELFNANDPDIARGEIPTARDLLTNGALRIGNAFDGNPAMRSDMLVILGNLNRRIGENETARQLLEEGLELANTIGEFETEIKALQTIALTDQQTGDNDKALESLKKAEDLLASKGLKPGKLHSSVSRNLTFLLSEMGHLAESVNHAEEALILARKEDYLEPETLYRYLDSMGRALVAKQEHGNAEIYFTEALNLNITLEEAPSWRMNMHNNLAAIRAYYGDHKSAVEHRTEAMELADIIYADIPGDTQRAIIRNNLSINLINTGQLGKAIELLQEALEIYGETYPDGLNNRVASVHNNLGLAYRHSEEWERAIHHYSKSRDINAELFGADDIRFGIISANIARPLSRLGRFYEAETMAQTAYDQYLKILGPDHTMIATVMRLFADIRLDENRPDEALTYADKALNIYNNLDHANTDAIISALEYRARALAELGRQDDALEVFKEAITLGNNDEYQKGLAWPQLLFSYTEFLHNRKNQDAHTYAALALSAYTDTFGPTHSGTRRMEAMANKIFLMAEQTNTEFD
ncbi:MAG: tetratricopeptide repeat protein [Balneolaceae bacterium]|nr:tetratricopeptide repeat protein [Balneolaceae bacterium]